MNRLLAIALFTGLLVGTLAPTHAAAPAARAAADEAWDRGDYPAAVKAYIEILSGPESDAHFEAIALRTGELYRTRELTADGRAPRFSPDGRFIAYETGLEISRQTRLLPGAGSGTAIDLPGVSATFSFDGRSAAYLRLGDAPDLSSAVRALDEAPLAGVNRNALIQALNFQVQRNATIVVRDLSTGQERALDAPGLLKTSLAFGADNRTVYFLGADENDPARNDIYSVTEGRAPSRVGNADGLKGVPTVDPTGAVLLYTVPGINPLRRPAAPGGPGGGGFGGGGAAPRFGVIDLASGTTRTRDGSAPTLSADGRTLAYVTARPGAESQLMLGAPLAEASAIVKATGRLDAPALSPDGARVAYQGMTRDDWEVFLVNRDGTGERRLTKDVQHDVVPKFVDAGHLLSAVGEPRHRRSFLHDLTTGTRVRLFHNNTIRTIAPEYQWSVSPSGQQILIGAERDGDTVSPERGVYLVNLGEKISKADLQGRLLTMLGGEATLREAGAKAYRPINAEVRRLVEQVSTSRIFGYEKALFDFDSKHITRPGNQLASEYLFNAYKSFGYEPEMQWFDVANALGGKTANVLATLRGTENPGLVYVVSSHYDSVPGGPGADDDTSGTAALL
ncbi:MAG: M28 family peptidase, partial [Vicinamibacterales bacterium]